MKSTDLDRRLTVLQLVTRPNELNEPVETWAEVCTVWASKRDVSDAERMRSAEAAATITTRFQVRWSSLTAGLDATYRARCDGRTYEVVAVKEIGRREGVEISATARAEGLAGLL